MSDEPLTTTSTEVLEHEAVTLAAQIAAVTCRWLLVIAELDRREAWGSWGCKSMAHWLSWRCSLSPGAAREHVRVARRLASLPLTAASFGRGELSYSKVRALTRVASAETEADLVPLARTATAAQLEVIIRASIVAMADPEARDAMRELHLSVDDDSFGLVRARLALEDHAVVAAALDRAAENVPAGTSSQRRADALVMICESYLAHGDEARVGADRVGVVIHAEVDESGAITSAHTAGGDPLHPETAARLACDSTLYTIVHGRLEPLGSGRTTRQPGRAMRRAVEHRSGGRCEWIGCDERRYVEIHHIQPWSAGGPTELWNLASLCWHHHHLVHEGGWGVVLDPDLGVRCFRPDGSELRDPVPVPVGRGSVPRTVDDERIVPLWCGERFDLSACVDAVLGAGARTG